MNVFFGEKGLTSTSANHIANLAKEYIEECEKELNSIRYYSTYISTINGQERLVSKGIDSSIVLTSYEMDRLDTIAQAKSLCAWLREAIKEKERLILHYRTMGIDGYSKETGTTIPEQEDPSIELIGETDVIESWDIKKRNRYYELEAKAATYGKYIHPGGRINMSKEMFFKVKSNPVEIKEDGVNTILYTYVPTVNESEVNDSFFALQNKYRSYQAELNKFKHDIELALQENKNAWTTENNALMAKFKVEYLEYSTKMKEYSQNKLNEVVAYKIVIPDALRNIYDIINNLGK